MPPPITPSERNDLALAIHTLTMRERDHAAIAERRRHVDMADHHETRAIRRLDDAQDQLRGQLDELTEEAT